MKNPLAPIYERMCTVPLFRQSRGADKVRKVEYMREAQQAYWENVRATDPIPNLPDMEKGEKGAEPTQDNTSKSTPSTTATTAPSPTTPKNATAQ